MERIGLIAGNGQLPRLFAEAAREKGLAVIAAAHIDETEPLLETQVERLIWVRFGQVDKIVRAFRKAGVAQAVMAGGFRRIRAVFEARPDWGGIKIISRLRSFRDDAVLREVARYFEKSDIRIVAPTELLPQVLAPKGHLAGPKLTEAQSKDVALGFEVARALGAVDVGQTVVVQGGHVLALEAVEGTDEAIRRGGRLAPKAGGVVVKARKPGQDPRFKCPAVGPQTLEVMLEGGLSVLAVEAGQTLLLDASLLFQKANRVHVTVVGIA